MTKEEYLKMYKEDKLAEICERLEWDRDELSKQLAESGHCIRELNKKCEEIDIWDDIEKVFEKLQFIPTKDFIELYYRMQAMINNHVRYINTCIPNYDKNGSASSHTSKLEDLRNITAIY